MKKMISWNVNGLRACLGKGFLEYLRETDADIFCIQESKLQEGQVDLDLPGYHQYWNYAEKKGYSGTAMFTKEEPVAVTYGLGIEEHDHEGRVITAEFPEYYVVTCYTPNSQDGLKRLDYRMKWEDAFRAAVLRTTTTGRTPSGRSPNAPTGNSASTNTSGSAGSSTPNRSSR